MVEVKRGDGGKFVKKSNGFTGSLEAAGAIDIAESTGNPNGATIINPADIGIAGNAANGGNQSEGGEQKRKPGRPAGYSPKKEGEKTLHLDGVSTILLSIHAMLAGITNTPELLLTEDESKKVADAATKVAKHYNFNATDKQMAWYNLTLVAGGIYGAKFFAYSARVKAEKKSKTQVKNTHGEAQPKVNQPPASIFPDLSTITPIVQ